MLQRLGDTSSFLGPLFPKACRPHLVCHCVDLPTKRSPAHRRSNNMSPARFLWWDWRWKGRRLPCMLGSYATTALLVGPDAGCWGQARSSNGHGPESVKARWQEKPGTSPACSQRWRLEAGALFPAPDWWVVGDPFSRCASWPVCIQNTDDLFGPFLGAVFGSNLPAEFKNRLRKTS